jgi:hypothetical protein
MFVACVCSTPTPTPTPTPIAPSVLNPSDGEITICHYIFHKRRLQAGNPVAVVVGVVVRLKLGDIFKESEPRGLLRTETAKRFVSRGNELDIAMVAICDELSYIYIYS